MENRISERGPSQLPSRIGESLVQHFTFFHLPETLSFFPLFDLEALFTLFVVQ
jgi:hypothetical protein